jgi:Xaa-Pro aminopeptidase
MNDWGSEVTVTVRIQNLRKKIEEHDYDAYIAADETNVGYLTNIPVPQQPLLLVKPDGNHLLYVLSDGLRIAETCVRGECEIKAADVGQSSLELLLVDLPKTKLKRIAFDSLSAQVYLQLVERAKATMFLPDAETMWELRTIKSPDEIENIRKAAKIADE